MTSPTYVDLTLGSAGAYAEDPETQAILQELDGRVEAIRSRQERFQRICDRFDALYYAEDFEGPWGADTWPEDPSASEDGRSHVSPNLYTAYVDIPASLQAVKPIENMRATDTTTEARHAAAALERVYKAWLMSEEYDLKWHKEITVKALYGLGASKVYWDPDAEDGNGKPCIEMIENPRNLWLGYKSDEYNELEWAAYCVRMDPNSVMEEFNVAVDVRSVNIDENVIMPFVDTNLTRAGRSWLSYGDSTIEVWDYWYRKPKFLRGKVKMETWNVVIAGNAIVSGPNRYPEYKGELPYDPVRNTFIPGLPEGRSELYDIEPLVREMAERVTAGSQMIAGATAGNYWQLTGPEAPSRVSAAAKPVLNGVAAPGAGNRIEAIQPFIAQFQLEQYLGRIDRLSAIVSGLNDLLLGLAPAQVLSSSKAINALIANYESRLAMRRKLLYAWKNRHWEKALKVWTAKNKDIKAIVDAGGGVLEITDPSLSPRDEMETAQRAINLVNAKLWTQIRGMDAVGVDDPEDEQNVIREERTDATLFPADVQVMAQLMQALQALNLPQPGAAVGQAGGMLASGQSGLASALGSGPPGGTVATQDPSEQGIPRPEDIPPGGAADPNAQALPFAAGPPAPGGGGFDKNVMQSMVQGGKASGRILTQKSLGKR